MMHTYEVLEKALALIEDEKNWCKLSPGLEDGSPKCAVGAVCWVRGINDLETLGDEPAIDALDLEVAKAGCDYPTPKDSNSLYPIERFNDSHTHAEVVALFQRAIAAEKHKAGVVLDVPKPVKEAVS